VKATLKPHSNRYYLMSMSILRTFSCTDSFAAPEVTKKNGQSRIIHLNFAQDENDYSSLHITKLEKEHLSTTKEEDREVEMTLPTTLYDALEASHEARVIIEASPPFRITNVNHAWENLYGYKIYECYGNTMDIIRGPETDMAAIAAFMNQLTKGETAGLVLTNYAKDGKKLRNRLRAGPLFGDIDGSNAGQITHFIGVLKEIDDWRRV